MFQATTAAPAAFARGACAALRASAVGIALASGGLTQAALPGHASLPLYSATEIPAVCDAGLTRARMKEVIQELEEARQEFERDIRDNKTKLTFTPEEMRGMPAAYLEKSKRDSAGNYVLGFEYPEYFSFMTNADDEEARRRYYVEFTNRGTARNMEVLAQVLDLFPRDDKFSHAANFGVRSTSLLANRAPYAVLVANLDRKGLESAELETLVHEFGCALHHMFARTAYVAHGGSGLEWDFVEAPSQMYEEWARRPESLQLLSRFCTGCKTVDRDLARRIESARKLGMGLRYLNQHLFADYDITLYGDIPVDPLKTWERMEGETVLGHTPGTMSPSSFEHIIRGYAAGYYGYMWSEVLALDMLSPYGTNIMNPTAGRRFRETILAHGGGRPAARMVEEFPGRKLSNAAFVAEITGRRESN